MKKRIVISATIAVLMVASTYAQAKNFFELARTGTPQEVQEAIDKGADVNAVSSSYGMTPLGLASARNPNLEVITILLKAGADINALDPGGDTALRWAAHVNPNPEVIALLLKAGADVNARNTKYYGRTALMWAAEHSLNPEVISVLLKGGSDAKMKGTDGKTALDLAQHNYPLKRTDALKQLEEASK